MKNIFDGDTSAEILSRMEKLQPDSKALWGKMNAAQMLAHLQATLEIAMSEKKMKRSLMGLVFGKMAKKKLFSDKPFDKNLSTDPYLVKKGQHDFQVEKTKLRGSLHRLVPEGETSLSKFPILFLVR